MGLGKKFSFISLCVYLFGGPHTSAWVWGSEDSLQGLVLSYHVVPEIQTPVVVSAASIFTQAAISPAQVLPFLMGGIQNFILK